ncbi:hypothetical protein KCU68_g74, partial [Aureobasidium melanogenum]
MRPLYLISRNLVMTAISTTPRRKESSTIGYGRHAAPQTSSVTDVEPSNFTIEACLIWRMTGLRVRLDPYTGQTFWRSPSDIVPHPSLKHRPLRSMSRSVTCISASTPTVPVVSVKACPIRAAQRAGLRGMQDPSLKLKRRHEPTSLGAKT